MGICSFRCRDTEDLYRTGQNRRFSAIGKLAIRKLDMLHAARALSDLRSPPGNRLELLKGDRVGSHSIRINDQWRLCFRWIEGGAWDVEIVDYH